MTALRSLLFNVAFWVWTLCFGLIMLPCLIRASWCRWIPDVWIDVTLWLLKTICNLRIEVRGQVPTAPCIVAAKHQSALDTLVLWRLMRGPAFILKYQLCLIPVFGWYLMRMQPVAIRRTARADALKAIEQQGKQRIAQGRSIVIFPEGTRTKPRTTTRYKTGGISVLYQALAVSVVPVALNTGCFWGRHAFIKREGVAVFEFLPPIEAGKPVEQMVQQLTGIIEDASLKLLP